MWYNRSKMQASPEAHNESTEVEMDPSLKNATLVRRVAGYVVYKSYDEEGRLLGETALLMKPMFSDEDLIEAGFMKAAQ